MYHRIYWNNFGRDSYLAGTRLRKQGADMILENSLISPGARMHIWSSNRNYQAARDQAVLPLLTRGATYRIGLLAEMKPQASIYVRINFYNRFQKSIAFTILKTADDQFTYPLDAYSYDIELVNAGCVYLHFQYLELEALNPTVSTIKGAKIFFAEPNQQKEVEESMYARQPNVKIFADNSDYLYLTDRCLEEIKEFLAQQAEPFPLYFIGSGPIGNFAAVYYATYVSMSQAYVTTDFYGTDWYQRKLDDLFQHPVDIRRFVGLTEDSSKVRFYDDLATKESLAFIAGSLNRVDYALQLVETE
ncbi:accessory Sec system protein Asp3 [Streptococcus pneumoniae]